MVLRDAYDDPIPRRKVGISPTVGDEVETFGGVAGEDDFRRFLRTYEAGHFFSGIFIVFRGLHTQRVKAPEGTGIVFGVELSEGFQYDCGPLGGGGIIQIDKIRIRGEEGKISSDNFRIHLSLLRNGGFLTVQ